MVTSIIHAYRDDPRLRQSFNRLARDTFGLDFEPWYQNGFWGGQYDPWSLLLDGEIAANVSVNRINCLLDGQRRQYLQLGTVMTRADLRGRGAKPPGDGGGVSGAGGVGRGVPVRQ